MRPYRGRCPGAEDLKPPHGTGRFAATLCSLNVREGCTKHGHTRSRATPPRAASPVSATATTAASLLHRSRTRCSTVHRHPRLRPLRRCRYHGDRIDPFHCQRRRTPRAREQSPRAQSPIYPGSAVEAHPLCGSTCPIRRTMPLLQLRGAYRERQGNNLC